MTPRVYDDLVDNVNLIKKGAEAGKPDVMKEVVKYTYDPSKNMGIMSQFGRDFTDANGVVHKGKYAVYDTLTQPKLIDKIYELKDRDSWDKVK